MAKQYRDTHESERAMALVYTPAIFNLFTLLCSLQEYLRMPDLVLAILGVDIPFLLVHSIQIRI
jgi:hypothetical protein